MFDLLRHRNEGESISAGSEEDPIWRLTKAYSKADFPDSRNSLGYAVDEINSEDINAAASDNVIKSLTGKIAGSNINQTSGGEGSSTRIILRGNRYLGTNNQALIVVDGIPIDNTTRGTSYQ